MLNNSVQFFFSNKKHKASSLTRDTHTDHGAYTNKHNSHQKNLNLCGAKIFSTKGKKKQKQKQKKPTFCAGFVASPYTVLTPLPPFPALKAADLRNHRKSAFLMLSRGGYLLRTMKNMSRYTRVFSSIHGMLSKHILPIYRVAHKKTPLI